jgi:hypothetical protein
MLTLTDAQWLGFSIYLGFKASHRRSEMERLGISYELTVQALTDQGVIKGGRIQPNAYALFHERFPAQIASQTHQVQARLAEGN